MTSSKTLILFASAAVLVGAFFVPRESLASPACVRLDGSIKVKKRCNPKKGETPLNFNDLSDSIVSRVGSLKTGSGSGLDADLLDGINSTEFASAGNVSSLAAGVSSLDTALTAISSAVNDLSSEVGTLATPPFRTIRVALSGGDFSSVCEALASITDASATTPYLVQVGPGVFNETQTCQIPSFVHLRGSGQNTTQITSNQTAASPLATAATLEMGDQSQLSQLTVTNTGNGNYGIGIFTNTVSRGTLIDSVVVQSIGSGGLGHYAVFLRDGEPTIRRSRLRASGATGFGVGVNAGLGVVNVAGGFPRPLIEHSALSGGGVDPWGLSCTGNTGTGFGVQAANAAPEIISSYICGDHRGLQLNVNGIARIHHSQLWAGSLGTSFLFETTASATATVAHSMVAYTNKHSGNGGLTCIQSHKSTFVAASDGTTPATACN